MDNSLNLTSEIAYRLKQFYPPILLTIGVPGNILSIFVLHRLRSTQPSIYLVSLACADLLVLCVCVLLDWIGVLLNIESTEEYPIYCKLQTFGYFSTTQLSSWFLVLVTMERVVSVIYPHRVRVLLSFQRVVLSISLTIACIACLNMHFVVQNQDSVSENSTVFHCFDRLYYNSFLADVWPWIDMSVGFLIPCILLVIGNVSIVIRIRRKVAYTCEVAVVSQTAAIANRRGKASVVTKRVILLNTIYIICMLPAFVYAVLRPYCFSDYSTSSLSELFYVTTSMFMFANNSVNFLLYIFLGAQFRKELLNMMTCRQSSIGRYKTRPRGYKT